MIRSAPKAVGAEHSQAREAGAKIVAAFRRAVQRRIGYYALAGASLVALAACGGSQSRLDPSTALRD